ncbi:phenylpyruvate tautomerase MIF-related protein [Avibacterium gallinarum]|uniref:phenylpyruvate tautomerase MIF-related protein n=1 Tax=Avibacterium gallinarum TaxID=755 RepID=UPI0039FC7BF5
MPFIQLQTNQNISAAQETAIKTALGKAIAHIPHKSEQSLMIALQANTCLYLKGEKNSPMALLTASVFANRSHQGYAEFAQSATQAISEQLHIAPQNIYLKYEDLPAWSVAGHTFSENA